MTTGTRPTGVPVYLGQLVQFGSITAAVPFFDVGLPSGYSRFQFFFSGVTVSAADHVSAALYIAGNFECDPVNNDTYLTNPGAATASLITLTPIQGPAASVNFRAASLADIYPGDLENFPFVIVDYAWGQQTVPTLVFQGQAVSTLNGGAVLPRSRGSATMMRVLPKGAGDCNPPTSGETINTGDWRLYAYN